MIHTFVLYFIAETARNLDDIDNERMNNLTSDDNYQAVDEEEI